MKTLTLPTQDQVLALWRSLVTAHLSHEELVEKINSIKRSCFVSIKALTECQKSKAKNAQVVEKMAYVNGLVNTIYVNGVLREMTRQEIEAKWEEEGRTWGERRKGFIYHTPASGKWKGQPSIYLSFRPMQVLEDSKFFMNGKQVDKSEVAHLIKSQSVSKKQLQAGIPVDKQINERDYNLFSIQEIAIDNERFGLKT